MAERLLELWARAAPEAEVRALATELTELEHEVESSREIGVTATKLAEIGRIAAQQNHELRQPVMAIKALAQFATDDACNPALVREHALQIIEQADRMARLLATMANIDLTPQPGDRCEVAHVVRQVASLMSYRVGRRIALDVDVQDGLPSVRGGADRLEQVLVNLVGNAMDAVEDRGRGTVVVRARPGAGEKVNIFVADDGPGITPEVRARLFQGHFTTKGPARGTGLGLVISRGLLRAAGGAIELDDVDACGPWPLPLRTVFRVTLPVS
jgi:two-component system C4-dicarboxylate transport sensor histidine kinase DctB